MKIFSGISIYVCLTYLALVATAYYGRQELQPSTDMMYFLNGHNSRRQLLRDGKVSGQITPVTMPPLIWNETLETYARIWAERCLFQHDSQREMGENLGYSSSKYYDLMESWWKEHINYKYTPMTQTNPTYLHYTQMASANTRSVGCWRNFCPYILTGNKYVKDMYYTVCRYHPNGNIEGQYPFEIRNPRRRRSVTTATTRNLAQVKPRNPRRRRSVTTATTRNLAQVKPPGWSVSLEEKSRSHVNKCRFTHPGIPNSRSTISYTSDLISADWWLQSGNAGRTRSGHVVKKFGCASNVCSPLHISQRSIPMVKFTTCIEEY